MYTPRRNIVNLGEVSNVVNVSMSVVLGGEWRDIYKLNMRLIHLGVIPVIL